jgi:hypothetical protein
MNAYVRGAYAIATHGGARSPLSVSRDQPVTAKTARAVISACIGALEERYGEDAVEVVQQFKNMEDTIERRRIDVLPELAADVLEGAARKAVDLCAGPDDGSDNEDPVDEEADLIVDFGYEMSPVQEVVDEGDFVSNTDGEFEINGIRSTIGPRGRAAVVGVAVLEWDNHNTYKTGEIVYFAQRHWRAVREVTPPFFPALMKGDEPGTSNAWAEVSAKDVYGGNVAGFPEDEDVEDVYGAAEAFPEDEDVEDVYGAAEAFPEDEDVEDVYGAAEAFPEDEDVEDVYGAGDEEWPEDEDIDDVYGDVVGAEDIAARQKQMNNLKPVTIGIAKILLKYGQQAIHKAIEGAKQPWYRADLPGETARQTALGKLQWHANAIAAAGTDQNAPYASAADLKKWVMQSFIEQNAVEEGNAAAAQMWSLAWDDYKEMMAEVAVAIAALPKEIVQAIAKLPGQAFEALTGIPSWAFYVGTVALVGLVGYGAYKILAGPVGGAVVGHYLGRR